MSAYPRPSPDVSRYCEQRGFSFRVCECGFGYLLDRWVKIVAEVETGYRGLFDEYLNDMDARKIIDELATYASDDEWEAVDAALPSLDARFLAASRPVDVCIWGERNVAKHGYRPDRDWWYYRVPVDLSRVGDRGRWP
jgi:hypothetical protein